MTSRLEQAAADPFPDPEWEFPEPPTDLIFGDGEPLESNRHRITINVLIDSTLQAFQGKTDFFTGGKGRTNSARTCNGNLSLAKTL